MAKLIKEDDCPACEEGNEGWIFTYADMITLLFCFFVILFSMCQPDSGKSKTVSHAFRIMPPGSPFVLFGKGSPFEEESQHIENLDVPDDITLNVSEGGIEIAFKEKISFELGSTELSTESKNTLLRVIPIMANFPNDFLIAGHSDGESDVAPPYSSSWDLSTARASMVAHFIEEHGIPGKQLQIAGFGHYHPLFFSDTSYQRSLNRRVEITLIPKSLNQ